ncbi:MAG: GerAB/ArcD/ProY family transporter, partial [Oscillospiraceae bacterium]|nr:GerAB/ArcD/ProY family transporter [Oscillospiraceae bacterium]
WGGILYVVWLGLESFARLSVGVFVLFVLLVAALAVQGVPNLDPMNLHNPLAEGFAPLAKGTALSVARCGELSSAVLLVPAVRDKAHRWSAKACLLWTGFTLVVSFLTLTVLGNFAATRSYPVYTLALAGGEQAVFGRLDALLLLVWIFLAVVRGGLYWWVSGRCLFLLTARSPLFCIGVGGLPILALALLSDRLKPLWQSPLLWGGTVLAVTLLVPLIILLSPTAKGGGKA